MRSSPFMACEGPKQDFRAEVSPESGTVKLSKPQEPPGEKRPPWKFELKYKQPGPDQLVLEGELEKRRIRATLRRVDESEFLLLSRGFHWINETPFNTAVPRGSNKKASLPSTK